MLYALIIAEKYGSRQYFSYLGADYPQKGGKIHMCSKTVGDFMKGMGMGLVVGGTAGIIGTCYMQKNKKGIKRNAGKALHSIGDLLEHVPDMC